MFSQVVDAVLTSISAAYEWTTKLFNAMPGALSFVIGFFVVFLSFRFLLGPLVHGDNFRHVGASDQSSKNHNTSEE